MKAFKFIKNQLQILKIKARLGSERRRRLLDTKIIFLTPKLVLDDLGSPHFKFWIQTSKLNFNPNAIIIIQPQIHISLTSW